QETIGLVVADDLLSFRIEAQRPAQPVRRVRQMDQCAGDVSVVDTRVQLFCLSTAHAADEVGEMIAARLPAGPSLPVGADPALVAEAVFVSPCQVSLRSVKDVADRIVAVEQTATEAGFIVRDPMPHFELHHLAMTVGLIELER